MIKFILTFILLVQFLNVKETLAGYDNHVAFYCGRPSMVFIRNKWINDFQQSCIKDEMGIVSYCKRTFPHKNISSAEPAIKKLNFTKWCDFENKHCNFNVAVRPFKCLEANFQSDALTLPKNCLFAHLGGKRDCKIYKDWVNDAKEECSKKPDFEVRSYGMLFQCGKSGETISPMFFRGVEFVCCPIERKKLIKKVEKITENNIYKSYFINGILQSENEENKMYDETLLKLDQSEMDIKNDINKDYINGENALQKLWKSDPKLAKSKEDALISQFKKTYNSIINQYIANKEKLLTFHDDRLKFIFTTKFDAALRHLKDVLEKPHTNKLDIREVMKQVLDLLMIRKKEILEERSVDENLGSHMINLLNKELNFIENSINNVFNNLEKIPQWKATIKQYLVMHLLNTYPRISFEKPPRNDHKISELEKIISQYRHKPETDDDATDDQFQVHYDLGLHDKDQSNSFSRNGERFIFDHDPLEEQHGHKRLLLGLLSGVLGTAFIILILGSILIMYRHRSTMFKYALPKFQEQSKHMMHGFGQIGCSAVGKDVINSRPLNVYENPTYIVAQTNLNTTPDIPKQQTNELVDENAVLPLIKS